MHVIQIFLPIADNDGQPFSRSLIESIKTELIERFGGITAYGRAPAEGVWARNGTKERDDIVIVEVMAKELDESWWSSFRQKLEEILRQNLIVIRVHQVKTL